LRTELHRVELHDDRSMAIILLAAELVRSPVVGQVGAKQHQVAVAVIADMVADEARPRPALGEADLDFRVVVPAGRPFDNAAVEAANGATGRRNQLFKRGLHVDACGWP
jgi:hypothetical protein